MRSENCIQVTFRVQEVKVTGGRLKLEGKVRLELPQPPQDRHLPNTVERTVEEAGQKFKRWAFQHLMEKLDAELALATRQGRDGHLWEGRVDEALEVLTQHRTEMKNRPALDQIVEYIRNRRPYLPNYGERRDAGLWIASNRVEKLNDWTTSQRCKGRGMDWTRDGVVALAVLESARRNGELPVWRRTRFLPAWTAIPVVQQAA